MTAAILHQWHLPGSWDQVKAGAVSFPHYLSFDLNHQF